MNYIEVRKKGGQRVRIPTDAGVVFMEGLAYSGKVGKEQTKSACIQAVLPNGATISLDGETLETVFWKIRRASTGALLVMGGGQDGGEPVDVLKAP